MSKLQSRAAEASNRALEAKATSEGASDVLIRVGLTRRLCALITEGVYKPGDRMTERELCDRLDASRPSVRETLRQLEAEGLIDIHPNRGAVVRPLNVDTLLELWEVRLALETLVVERFARHGMQEHIVQLEAAIDFMEAALRSGDVGQTKASKNAFYEALCAGAQNNILTAHIEKINVRLSFLWSTSLGIPGRPAESIGELRVLVQAIKSHNPDMARAAIVLHTEHAKAIAMYALSAFENASKT